MESGLRLLGLGRWRLGGDLGDGVIDTAVIHDQGKRRLSEVNCENATVDHGTDGAD